MKYLLAGLFVLLLFMSGLALWMQPLPPRDGKTHLTWMSDQNPAHYEQIRIFNLLHPKIEERLDPPDSGSSIQKIVVQATSGVGPDSFDTFGSTNVQVCAEAGVLWDVTAQAQAHGFSTAADLWPTLVGQVTYQGVQYTYPANVNVNVLIYNKNVFDHLGVPYPAEDLTWEEFFALARRFPHSEEDPNSLYAVTRIGWKDYFNSLRGEYFSEDGVHLTLQDGILREAMQMTHDALFKYRITPRSLDMKAMSSQGGWGGDFSSFANGQFAMISNGKWALIALRQARDDQENKLRRWEADPHRNPKTRPQVLRIGAVMLPHMAGHPRSYLAEARSVGINVYSPHREEAVQFLAYLAGPEYSRTINEGVDGLPGNPKYAREGLLPGHPDLSEIELHERSIDSMPFGRTPRLSPFLLASDIERIMGDLVSRMEVSPELSVDDLIAAAQRELQTLLQRNLDRDPKLKREYERRLQAERVAAVATTAGVSHP